MQFAGARMQMRIPPMMTVRIARRTYGEDHP